MRKPPVFSQSWRRFWRCRRGATAIEFAFGGPIVILAVAGVIELSMIMFVTTLLEGGLREASRFGITGANTETATREEHIKALIAEHTIGLVDVDQADLTYLVYQSFDSIGQPEPFTDVNGNGTYDEGEPFTDVNNNDQWDADQGEEGVGGPGDIVLYKIVVDWPLVTPLLVPFIGEEGIVKLGASLAVRNEPYLIQGSPVIP